MEIGREVVISYTTSMDVAAALAPLPGEEAKRLGMGPAVVLGQDLGEAAGPVGDGAMADLAAREGKTSNGDGEAAGT